MFFVVQNAVLVAVLNARSVLNLLPIFLLSFVPVVGMGGVARSEVTVQQPANQSQVIDQLIQQLKTGDLQARSSATKALGKMGESAKSAISSLIPLLNDSDVMVRSAATAALKKLGYKP